MMTEPTGTKRAALLTHFDELRKYIEFSHDGLSKRLEKVETGVEKLDGRVAGLEDGQKLLEGGQQRLERKLDAGFDRIGRKIDALAPARRATSRRRKR